MRLKIARLSLLTAVCLFGQAWPGAAQMPSLPYRRDHPPTVRKKGSKKIDFLYLMSEGSFAGATWFDGWTTERGLRRYAATESGWARCFGDRNTFGVVSANVALNLGVEDLSRRLYRRGGRWRFVAIGLVTAKTVSSALAGAHNLRLEERIDERMHNSATTAPITAQ